MTDVEKIERLLLRFRNIENNSYLALFDRELVEATNERLKAERLIVRKANPEPPPGRVASTSGRWALTRAGQARSAELQKLWLELHPDALDRPHH